MTKTNLQTYTAKLAVTLYLAVGLLTGVAMFKIVTNSTAGLEPLGIAACICGLGVYVAVTVNVYAGG